MSVRIENRLPVSNHQKVAGTQMRAVTVTRNADACSNSNYQGGIIGIKLLKVEVRLIPFAAALLHSRRQRATCNAIQACACATPPKGQREWGRFVSVPCTQFLGTTHGLRPRGTSTVLAPPPVLSTSKRSMVQYSAPSTEAHNTKTVVGLVGYRCTCSINLSLVRSEPLTRFAHHHS